MGATWTYENGTAYADGTGTYERGWYAASPFTAEAGAAPDEGPFGTAEEARERAAWLAEEGNGWEGEPADPAEALMADLLACGDTEELAELARM